jgi:hypothetical protein
VGGLRGRAISGLVVVTTANNVIREFFESCPASNFLTRLSRWSRLAGKQQQQPVGQRPFPPNEDLSPALGFLQSKGTRGRR